MQHYAFDLSGKLVFVKSAQRQIDYQCPECKGVVHRRGGFHRQDHFYHLEVTPDCRQNGKSVEHLNVQLYFLHCLPEGECFLEQRFPEINRIADVVWTAKKIIFEIQCSPISSEEVLRRNLDYISLGFEVIWILHDKRFNQKRISGAESVLFELPHYFTNMTEKGEGLIYDQFTLRVKGQRFYRLPPLPINVSQYSNAGQERVESRLNCIQRRLCHGSFYFSGDLTDLDLNKFLYPAHQEYIEAAINAEKAMERNLVLKEEAFIERMRRLFLFYVKRPCQLILQLLLERACK